ncbi:MAG TPA: hypothetical protein VGM49_08940 [Candidatus Limnocylindrales bacterium]|jgi:hypothetical protein
MSTVRTRRLDPWNPVLPVSGETPRRSDWSLAARAEGIGNLDLGSRIGAAADLQLSVGNGATTQMIGLARTDRKKDPPGGVGEIIAASGPGNRGLTRTSYNANPPVFRAGGAQQAGTGWSTHPAEVRLPSLDHEVMWPGAGLHLIRSLGKGSQFLDVSPDWSDKLGVGETEHVTDLDAAYAMTWGKVAGVLNAMAKESFTGATVEAAQATAWTAFKSRLPEPLRPEGDTPTTEAQEKKWGADDKETLFRKLMNESKRARDNSGWHTPDESLKTTRGDDRIDELSKGNSRIDEVKTEKLMKDAWDRLAKP